MFQVNPDQPLIGIFITDFLSPLVAYFHFILVVNSHTVALLDEKRKQNRSAGEILDEAETFQYDR